MPKETDERRIALLLRLLTDTASNVVLFHRRAFSGSDEYDDLGLDRILPAELSREAKRAELRVALVEILRGRGRPNRIEYWYEHRDPETIYEFRFAFHGTRVYVKTELKQDDPSEPILVVRSVKRQN